jgi:hypothetical protein
MSEKGTPKERPSSPCDAPAAAQITRTSANGSAGRHTSSASLLSRRLFPAEEGGATVIMNWRMRLRRVWAGICLALVAAACGGGGGEVSLTDYVGHINIAVDQAALEYFELVASPQGKVLVAEAEQLTDFTPQDLQAALEHVREIEAEFEHAVNDIEPPEEVADLHRLLFDFDSDFISAQEALAVRAGTAENWEELSASPEMAAYRTALTEDKQHCSDTEAEMNAIADRREVFADTPWIPGELKDVVEAVLGCTGYPEHPEDLYRPLPVPTS